MSCGGLLSLAPEYILDVKWTTMVDESTLNLTVILHGTTRIRCIAVLQVNDNKIHDCLTPKVATESNTRFNQPIQRENKDYITSLFDYI